MKLEEIAKLAGVSRTTASYVINDKAKKYRVSDKTIEKVMAVVKKYNFQPNAVAAGLRAGKTKTIGIIIPDLENTSYMRIANNLEKLIRKEGYQLLLAFSEDDPEIEKACIEHLKQRQVDALIISSAFIANSNYSFYDGWDNSKCPLIALDRALPTSTFKSVVGADKEDAKVLTLAFDQFVKGNIVYVGASPELSVSQLRKDGFKSVKMNHCDNIDFICANYYSRHSAEEAVSMWLENNAMPSGFFTTSFSLLQGTIDAILRKYKQLPDNLTIATFGDNDLLDFLPCNVIGLSQNHKAIAETTMSLLLDELRDNNHQPGMTIIPRRLIYRGRLSRTEIK